MLQTCTSKESRERSIHNNISHFGADLTKSKTALMSLRTSMAPDVWVVVNPLQYSQSEQRCVGNVLLERFSVAKMEIVSLSRDSFVYCLSQILIDMSKW